jgi:pyrroloquinoline quinone biosynthesis protein D
MNGLSAHDVPRLPRGVRLHFDVTRGAHVLLAPERAFNVDAIAVAVLELVDGRRSVEAIVGLLAQRFNEMPAVIEPDVVAMLDDLLAKRVVER